MYLTNTYVLKNFREEIARLPIALLYCCYEFNVIQYVANHHSTFLLLFTSSRREIPTTDMLEAICSHNAVSP